MAKRPLHNTKVKLYSEGEIVGSSPTADSKPHITLHRQYGGAISEKSALNL